MLLFPTHGSTNDSIKNGESLSDVTCTFEGLFRNQKYVPLVATMLDVLLIPPLG